ncbi:tape measure protein [Agromyces sp. S2-1-8]|uniref:phage tail protein n=1 Tax=Agromyces sp. S2-1-8 TaxID=2897180 RepID=UPI001E63F307|nr:tape measure protein [Agromyces sp. S2-1-8]MCD5345049.1 tape measure protein [Agromyces sp. S2-1-8]
MAGQTVIVSVLADTKPLKRGFDNAGRDAGGLFSTLGKIGKFGVGAVAGIGAAVGALALKGGISRALNIEDARAALGGLGHDTKSIDAIMKSALQSVKGTAFGLGDAATIASTAVAAGIQPGEKLTRTLTLTANAAALAKVGLGDMGSILNKVWTNGKVQTDELNQLADRGIPIWTKLAEHYKVNGDELRKMVSSGKVDAETFAAVLEGTVGNAAAAMGNTTRGAWANMVAAFSRGGAALIGGSLPLVKTAFQSITGIVDSATAAIAPGAERMWGSLTAKLTPVLQGIGPLVSGFVGNLKSMLGGIDLGQIAQLASMFSPLGLVFRALQPVLPQLAATFGQLAGVIGGVLAKVLPIVANLVGQLVKMLSGHLSAILPIIADLVMQLAGVFAELLPALMPIVEIVGAALSTVFRALMPIITEIAATLGGVLGTVIKALTPVITMLAQILVDVLKALMPIVPAVLPLIKAVLQLISPLLKLIGAALEPIIGLFAALLKPILALISPLLKLLMPAIEAVTGVLTVVIDVIAGVLGWFVDLITGSKNASKGFTNAFNSVAGFFSQLMRNVVGFFSNGIQNILHFFRSLPSQIWNAVINLWNTVTNLGRNLVQGLANGIWNASSAVWNAIGGVVNGAIDWAKSLLGIHSPSRVFRKIGTQTMDGLEIGLSKLSGVKRAMGRVADVMSAEYTPTVGIAGIGAAGGRGGNTYQVTVQAVAPNAEVGRAVVEAIDEFERFNGGNR